MSCDPTCDTRTAGASPVSAATAARTGPSGVPGSDTGLNSDAGSPSSATSAASQVRPAGSNSPVVDAFVASASLTPDSQ